MSERFQAWLLRSNGFKMVQYIVNERLAKRSGLIGKIARAIEMGERQYSQHAFGRAFRVVNYYWVQIYHTLGVFRPVLSRLLIGVSQGPLNYSALFMWFWLTFLIVSRFRFIRARDVLQFNHQDNPEFWYQRYNMMFPPNFLHNRISAHYIEINHIFAIEMMKRYQVARKEILAERERQPEEVRRTKYITNPNYVYEPMGPDDDKIKRLKDDGLF
jgi:hypothetical protein